VVLALTLSINSCLVCAPDSQRGTGAQWKLLCFFMEPTVSPNMREVFEAAQEMHRTKARGASPHTSSKLQLPGQMQSLHQHRSTWR
jgi:hypothetical protein